MDALTVMYRSAKPAWVSVKQFKAVQGMLIPIYYFQLLNAACHSKNRWWTCTVNWFVAVLTWATTVSVHKATIAIPDWVYVVVSKRRTETVAILIRASQVRCNFLQLNEKRIEPFLNS